MDYYQTMQYIICAFNKAVPPFTCVNLKEKEEFLVGKLSTFCDPDRIAVSTSSRYDIKLNYVVKLIVHVSHRSVKERTLSN